MKKLLAAGGLTVAAILLTGCEVDPQIEATGDAAAPSSSASATPSPPSEPTPRSTAGKATPSPISESPAAKLQPVESLISGDIYADVAAAGFVPRDYSMDEAIAWMEDDVCMSATEATGSFGSPFQRRVRSLVVGTTTGHDPLRVVAYYKCPSRSAVLDPVIESALEEDAAA